jgi:hypothetical protein
VTRTVPPLQRRPRRSAPAPVKPPVTRERGSHPVYRFWHGHISALIAAQRPDADAATIAHVILGALHSEPILAQLATEGPQRLIAALRAMVCAVLDTPAGGAAARARRAGARPAKAAEEYRALE